MKPEVSKLVPFDVHSEQRHLPYLVEDPSVLTPFCKRFIWKPLLRLVPNWMSANTLTLLAHLSSVLSLVAAILAVSSGQHQWFALSALGVFISLNLDNMDGPQARQTGTSSPMGEFLDHWLDSINMIFLGFAGLLAMGVPHWSISIVLALGCLAFTAQFWEQRLTGLLRFGAFGSVESQIIAIALLLSIAIFGQGWITNPLIWGLSLGDSIVIAVVLGGLVTPLAIMLRVRKSLGLLLPLFVVSTAVVAWSIVAPIPLWPMAAILTGVSAYLGGRMVISRITDGAYYGLDWALIALVAIPVIGSPLGWSSALHLGWSVFVMIYLLVRISLDFAFTLLRLENFLKPYELLHLAMNMTRLAPIRKNSKL